MNIHMRELFDEGDLAQAIADGYVRRQEHPTLPLAILNYSEKAQYEKAWSDVTLACRGLIIDSAGHVLARPWKKWFNYSEHPEGTFDLRARVTVTDKWDGSLGILYPTPDGHAIATRGSFASEQAEHASKVWRDRYEGRVEVPDQVTLLFEIVYPGNRIVCDYGDMDDLVLLGGVDVATGQPAGPGFFVYDGPKAMTFTFGTLAEALAAPPRPGAEGVVVRFPDHDHVMIKLKQDDYVALHRIITNTTARKVWEFVVVSECAHLISKPKHWGSLLGLDPARAAEILAIGPGWLDKLTADVPDEFHQWLTATIDGLHTSAAALTAELVAETARLQAIHGNNRAALFAEAKQAPHFGEVMLLIDGRDITTNVWRAVYPDAGGPWLAHGEDVA